MRKEIVNVFFDLETTARGPEYNPEAQYKENKIVLCGWSIGRGPAGHSIETSIDASEFVNELQEILDVRGTPRLIAHNLKFDLKYLLRDFPDFPWNKCEYHCTMTHEYLSTGHKDKFISLEKLAAKHGVSFTKSLDLGALIKQGIDVASISINELTDYLRQDVKVLKLISGDYNGFDMNYILPLAKMELNGLPVDIKRATEMIFSQDNIAAAYTKVIEDAVLERCEFADGRAIAASDVKPLAPRTMSYILTGFPRHGIGGSAKAKPEKKIVFKERLAPILPYATVQALWGPNPKISTTLGYPINASVLDELCRLSTIAQAYKKAKDAKKLLNTYLYPFLQESAHTGGTVHPKLNTCATNTGRLSSSNPNGQNIPPVARQVFKSTEGELYEVDFNQLEMIGAATLSNDKRMIEDLRNGVYIHYETGKSVFNWKTEADMTKDTKRVVKGVNFGLLYGGGAAGIAENTGADKATVQELIRAFYGRYPDVQAWQSRVLTTVQGNALPIGTKEGHSYRGSMYYLPSQFGGRRFYFEESESPLWMQRQTGEKYSFKPTETKNYPIQGFAGGDIVMRVLIVLDDILSGLGAKLRMTVHDSIVIDWTENKEQDLRTILNHVCDVVTTRLNIPVPLRFDIEHGENWQ